jgi:hypothetical protein
MQYSPNQDQTRTLLGSVVVVGNDISVDVAQSLVFFPPQFLMMVNDKALPTPATMRHWAVFFYCHVEIIALERDSVYSVRG